MKAPSEGPCVHCGEDVIYDERDYNYLHRDGTFKCRGKPTVATPPETK